METKELGKGFPLQVSDMPESPKWTIRSTFKWMGPAGFIAIGVGIGSGEFLLAPAAVVKFSMLIAWGFLVAVLLQTFQNTEMCRYTILTGEPITVGMMRLKPGKWFWLPINICNCILYKSGYVAGLGSSRCYGSGRYAIRTHSETGRCECGCCLGHHHLLCGLSHRDLWRESGQICN